ncbi:hypothetical protein AV530_004065 [Patagioenas fasciata monilis]|uniref:Uncharacterized protein n=1 Tax=Patagioenas fasciata monilis TaxID=372326 RepID=A0A1V4JTM9_PATFA|nr:hypothetical protein AV530_004065 [Patagioenas fasciata monilis]
MLKGSSDHELLIEKMTNALKPKGRMGDTGAKFNPAKLKDKYLRETEKGAARLPGQLHALNEEKEEEEEKGGGIRGYPAPKPRCCRLPLPAVGTNPGPGKSILCSPSPAVNSSVCHPCARQSWGNKGQQQCSS